MISKMAGRLSWSSLPSCLQKNWKCIQLKLPLSCGKLLQDPPTWSTWETSVIHKLVLQKALHPLQRALYQDFIPFNAMTLLAGFMIALSAEIGLRIGLLGSFMSMITTWACSPTFSLMQMNLSDSIVRVLNPMFAGLMPRFWSWKRKKKIKRFNIITLV